MTKNCQLQLSRAPPPTCCSPPLWPPGQPLLISSCPPCPTFPTCPPCPPCPLSNTMSVISSESKQWKWNILHTQYSILYTCIWTVKSKDVIFERTHTYEITGAGAKDHCVLNSEENVIVLGDINWNHQYTWSSGYWIGCMSSLTG